MATESLRKDVEKRIQDRQLDYSVGLELYGKGTEKMKEAFPGPYKTDPNPPQQYVPDCTDKSASSAPRVLTTGVDQPNPPSRSAPVEPTKQRQMPPPATSLPEPIPSAPAAPPTETVPAAEAAVEQTTDEAHGSWAYGSWGYGDGYSGSWGSSTPWQYLEKDD